MGTYDRFCQSCGMPMDKDPLGGGTNRDGSKSHKYCSFCYRDGEFVEQFASADEMVGHVQDKLKEMGYGSLKRWFFTSHIHSLERWKG
jgi:radical SAM superfamily enzyme